MSGNIQLWELAVELDVPCRDLIVRLAAMGVTATNAMSIVDGSVADRLRQPSISAALLPDDIPASRTGQDRSAHPRHHRYRLLLRYARKQPNGWLAILLMTLGTTAFTALQPLPLKVVVDNVLGGEPAGPVLDALPGDAGGMALLAWMVVAGLVVFAASSALDVGITMLWIKVGQAMVLDLTRDLFARLQRRPLLYHSATPVGESMKRVTDDSWAVHTVVDSLLFKPLTASITVLAIGFVMWHMDPQLTMIALLVAPLMVVASFAFGRPIREASESKRQVQGRLASHVQQTLMGIPVVQAFGQEDRQHERFEELAGQAIHSEKRAAKMDSLDSLAAGLSTAIGTAVVLYIGGRAVLAGNLSVGALLAVAAYLLLLQKQFKAFSDIYPALQRTRAQTDRVVELLHDDPPRDNTSPRQRVKGHIAIDGVTFGYRPDRPVLRNVSLEIETGERVAIVGTTGAGKSSLLGLVPRFWDPDVGEVRIDGHDIRELDITELRRNLAVVLQEPYLLPITIAANIAFGRPDASLEEIRAAARAARADSFIEALPHGYDTVVTNRGTTFSGGERQRIAIARAFLVDAPILLLDEPTSALDAETEADVFGALDRLMQDRTTLIIAHRLSTVRKADRIVVMERGGIVESGSHDRLLARSGRYAQLHRLQVTQ